MNGLPAALFLHTPTYDEVFDFKLKKNVGGDKLRAFGVAGIARSLNPTEMEKELNPIFSALARIPVDFFQYKICSTLDSAPEIGNIGVATDIALKYFPSANIPFIVGAPFLNRFVVFSNLFARLDDKTYRIDRHPVMAHHPVTPMQEGDIRIHLSKQTGRKFQTHDILQMQAGKSFSLQNDLDKSSPFLLFDTLTNDDLTKLAGALIKNRGTTTQFIVGSSGISYGLARYLKEKENDKNEIGLPVIPTGQILVAAGSCSPVTESQINYALKLGMQGVRIDVMRLVEDRIEEIKRVIKEALEVLNFGKSPVIFTALGPNDSSIKELEKRLDQNRNTLIGESIGDIVKQILDIRTKLRTVIVGGDTSGYVARYLKIYALETMAPVAPGAPLCIAHANDSRYDGLEIALKGGQNGKDDYFQRILG